MEHDAQLSTSDRPESLAACLQDLLASRPAAPDYAELTSVLGLGSAFTAVPDEPCQQWPTYARDAALAPAAELYGVRLRELHPPAAAVGLRHSREFARHFEDSYAPLIRRALDAGQTCLAWCGWATPAESEWGVVTGVGDACFLGRTWGRAARLAGPAWQVYVVEETAPVTATAAARFDAAVSASLLFWSDELARTFDVLFGEAALRAWTTALAETPPDAAHRQHGRVVRRLTAARVRLADWLRSIAADLDSPRRAVARSWADVCDRSAERLAPFTDEPELRRLLATRDGCDGLRAEINVIRGDESAWYEELAAARRV